MLLLVPSPKTSSQLRPQLTTFYEPAKMPPSDSPIIIRTAPVRSIPPFMNILIVGTGLRDLKAVEAQATAIFMC